MKSFFLLLTLSLQFSCSRINVESRDYYRKTHFRHGIVPLSSGLAKKLDEAAIARGKILYTKHCLQCHGVDGTGNGPEADKQNVPPTNLKKLVSEVPNFEFFMSISQWQGDMPGWKEEFSPIDRRDLEAYIKSF